MTNSVENNVPEIKAADKEMNFRQLEAKYEKLLAQERQAKEDQERRYQEQEKRYQDHLAQMQSNYKSKEDDDEDDDPYVNKRNLSKKFSNFERELERKIDEKAERKARDLIQKDKQENWIKTHGDFYEVMQKADEFAMKNPDYAENLLSMPEGFERQKLVYTAIKNSQIMNPPAAKESIQETIDGRRRSPYYYEPSSVGSAPYAGAGDFSPAGQKSAYERVQQLKNRLRIG